jgi:hypothetical protein
LVPVSVTTAVESVQAIVPNGWSLNPTLACAAGLANASVLASTTSIPAPARDPRREALRMSLSSLAAFGWLLTGPFEKSSRKRN